MASSKNVVFDIVGTLVGYEKLFEAIEERLGDRLKAHGVGPASLFGYTWIEVAEREYTYLSMSGLKFANADDLAVIMVGYKAMELRPGAKECVKKLRDAGFTVYGFTMGDISRVGGYFKAGGLDWPAENLLSCDTRGVGKPDPEAYRPLLNQLSVSGKPWFAAAHMWDVSAARRTGFKGAYCSVWESEPLTDLFGDMDVLSDSLPEMADKIIASSE
ncbi:hypothetical protein M409DRAFT_28122 [Zasmidium cellare ATCC 36951]|uniref:Uncharacterized protein n=1 Tax=Zasmidium cellare ATCC 36951 TaxID=1080233 RepID=A0A6A6C551_ZASCE|nr:uncharacterized protein M409DRAFT_28122 [Zasmidium cellare ATCC 36951]KAF2161388.1 hypothetical protein M409DRAFT_28122 [Zasmidium cellare ATCC 36951]